MSTLEMIRLTFCLSTGWKRCMKYVVISSQRDGLNYIRDSKGTFGCDF